MNHFKFTSEFKVEFQIKLYRIQATRDLPNGIKKGDLGGWIEKKSNLGNNAWVSGDAQVYGNARVSGNAWVSGDARVSGNAWVSGDAQVYGNARVYGDARVSGNAWVSGDAQVYGNARVYGNTRVYGNALVYGNAQVYGDAKVYGDAHIDSISAIIVLIIAMKYSVTITKKLVFIGCKIYTNLQIKKMTKKLAEKEGLPKEFYDGYKQMILGAQKLIK